MAVAHVMLSWKSVLIRMVHSGAIVLANGSVLMENAHRNGLPRWPWMMVSLCLWAFPSKFHSVFAAVTHCSVSVYCHFMALCSLASNGYFEVSPSSCRLLVCPYPYNQRCIIFLFLLLLFSSGWGGVGGEGMGVL